MARKELAVESVAEAYLALLAERGIEYLFANAGTDFAPLVEAFAKSARTGAPVPQPVLATHENLALSMAHGYAVASRRVPAVMVHVSVGTANGVCGALNAARENVPILFTAGRSPLTEAGLPGARDVYIHWAQEMFDQAGMLREIVKWEYELRNGLQLETVIDRALSVATTQPGGPVYLSLPREVLAEPLPGFSYDSPSRRGAARTRQGSNRGSGAHPRRGRKPSCGSRERRARSGGGRGARRLRAAICDPGRPAPTSAPLPPSRPSMPPRLRCRTVSGRGRRDSRARMRRAVDPKPQGAAPRMQSHSSRGRPAVLALSDPRFSVRSRADRHTRHGAAGA